jgi:hypothetical protein
LAWGSFPWRNALVVVDKEDGYDAAPLTFLFVVTLGAAGKVFLFGAGDSSFSSVSRDRMGILGDSVRHVALMLSSGSPHALSEAHLDSRVRCLGDSSSSPVLFPIVKRGVSLNNERALRISGLSNSYLLFAKRLESEKGSAYVIREISEQLIMDMVILEAEE